MRLQLFIKGECVFELGVDPCDKFSLVVDQGEAATVSKYTEELLNKFNEVRLAFPGKKRGNDTEFTNFRHKHKDWKEVLPLLLPAINNQSGQRMRDKYAGKFVPEWPMFSVWINQRRWEEETTTVQTPATLKHNLTFRKP